MSVHFDPDRQRYVVRWRDAGRQKSKRFRHEEDALECDARTRARTPGDRGRPEPSTQAAGDGVYAYSTTAGVRYRFVFRQSDGTLSSRRGFTTRRAAGEARRKLMASVDRGELTVCRDRAGRPSESRSRRRRARLASV